MTTRDLEPSCDPGGEASLSHDHDITDVITGPTPDDVKAQDPNDIMEEPQLCLLHMISSLRSSLTDKDYS